jgi:hypothetical protein
MIKSAIPIMHMSDPGAAERFYCSQLGFQKAFAYMPLGEKGPHYLALHRDGVRIHLSSFPEDSKAGAAVALIVDNLDELRKEYSGKGVKIDLEPAYQNWGNKEMYIRDADNNSIRFTQLSNIGG